MRGILLVVGDGIGNQAQTLPSLMCLVNKYRRYNVGVYNSIPTQTEATKLLFRRVVDDVYFSDHTIDRTKYDAQILTAACYGSPARNMKVLNKRLLKNRNKYSEVEFNLLSVDNHWEKSSIDLATRLFDHWTTHEIECDILIHNGYSKIHKEAEKRWFPKSYAYYDELVGRLKEEGLTVGSIGSKKEHIKGTVNLTGIKLKKSMSAIKSCKCFICNDTSTYHLANLIGKDNIVIFTFTDPNKNYYKRFHRYSRVIRRKDLDCSPCQIKGGFDFWTKNKKECKWACRDIAVDAIINKVEEILKCI